MAARYAVRVNGFDTIALTKLDVLDELETIPVCTGYRFEGETLDEMPADTRVLEGCEPVYEMVPGWKTPTAGVRDWAMLPENARRYVERLAELVGHRDRPRLDRPRPRADPHPRQERTGELV